MSEHAQKVSLSSWQWISLMGVVCGAGVWNVSQMWQLDTRWQNRIESIVTAINTKIETSDSEIMQEIAETRRSIPPDWFRTMVDENRKLITSMEREFTRDFIRKSELETLLEQREDK